MGLVLVSPPLSSTRIRGLIAALTAALVQSADADGAFSLGEAGGRPYDIKGWRHWDWAQGVGLYALARLFARTGEIKWRNLVHEWFEARLAEGEPVKTINTMAPLYALAELAEVTQDPRYDAVLADWAEWAMHGLPRTVEGGFQHIVVDQENAQQLWDDTLMMTALPLARIGRRLRRPAYVEEAKRQFLLHAKYLADQKTGLWFHGWTFDGRNHLSAALWARGNSWITMAIPDFVELLQLPAEDGVRLYLAETLKAQATALAAIQRADGLWPTLLDDPSSYGEASATAGFAYGLMKGVRLGILDARFHAVAQRALNAIAALVQGGELQQVSFGTPIFATRDEYRDVPITPMPYGQAMAILALDESAQSQAHGPQ